MLYVPDAGAHRLGLRRARQSLKLSDKLPDWEVPPAVFIGLRDVAEDQRLQGFGAIPVRRSGLRRHVLLCRLAGGFIHFGPFEHPRFTLVNKGGMRVKSRKRAHPVFWVEVPRAGSRE